MQINLPIRSFAFFKLSVGFFILTLSIIFPVAALVSLVVLAVGRAHTLGAWFAMWRAKKLNWFYIFCIFGIAVVISSWGFNFAKLETLAFVAYSFFIFHFMYDEFDLQEEKRNLSNIISSLNPTVLILLLLVNDFYAFNVGIDFFLKISLILLALEFIYIKEINWFFIQTKMLTFFILGSIFLDSSIQSILMIFLVIHYLFWFIYPVYKIHLHKREERDGFIMMILVIIIISTFVASSEIWNGIDSINIFLKPFYIASMVHVLSTAPFGYFIGLQRPKM